MSSILSHLFTFTILYYLFLHLLLNLFLDVFTLHIFHFYWFISRCISCICSVSPVCRGVLHRSFSSLMKIMLPRPDFFFFLDFLSLTWNNRKSHLSMMRSSRRAAIIGLFLKHVTAISSSSSPPLQHHSHPSHWCFHWNEGWRTEREERHCPDVCYRQRKKERDRNRIHTVYCLLL